MQQSRICDHYVIARENNVVRVDFARGREPPEPQFPGAGALRIPCQDRESAETSGLASQPQRPSSGQPASEPDSPPEKASAGLMTRFWRRRGDTNSILATASSARPAVRLSLGLLHRALP
jgi:hypothetical protein